jgi:hypothetical protein
MPSQKPKKKSGTSSGSSKKPAPKKSPVGSQKKKPALPKSSPAPKKSPAKIIKPQSQKGTAPVESATLTAPVTVPVEATKLSKTRAALDFSSIGNDLTVVQKKAFTLISKGERIAYLRGQTLFLDKFTSEYQGNFREVTAEEAKQKHYGRTRSMGSIATIEDLKRILRIYFN